MPMKKIFYSVGFLVLFTGISFSAEFTDKHEGYFTNDLSFGYYILRNLDSEDNYRDGYILHLRSKLIFYSSDYTYKTNKLPIRSGYNYEIYEILPYYITQTGKSDFSISLNLILTTNMEYGASVTMAIFEYKDFEIWNIGYGIWKSDYGKSSGFVFSFVRLIIPFHQSGNGSDAHLFIDIGDVYGLITGVVILELFTIGSGWGSYMW